MIYPHIQLDVKNNLSNVSGKSYLIHRGQMTLCNEFTAHLLVECIHVLIYSNECHDSIIKKG